MTNPIDFLLSGHMVEKDPYRYKGHLVYMSPLAGAFYIDNVRYEGAYSDHKKIIDAMECDKGKNG